MSKYIIEIAKEYEEYFKGVLLCGIADEKFAVDIIAREDLEELNSDYINEHYGQMQDEAYKRGINDGSLDVKLRVEGAYQRGLDDAWEAARKIVADTDHGGFAMGALCEIFDTRSYTYIMNENTAQEAVDKIKAYEDEQKKKDRIEVGDEVERYVDGRYDGRAMFLAEDGDRWTCLFWTGCGYTTLSYPKSQFKRTGRHYEIEPILEGIRNES